MATKRQIEANRWNWLKRRGLTPDGRERLHRSARKNCPWEPSTGPRTTVGRRRARENALLLGSFAATVEPFASANAVIRAERAYGDAAAILTAMVTSGAPGEERSLEEWVHRLLSVDAARRRADEERQVAWRRLASALGLPPPEAPAGFDGLKHIKDYREEIKDPYATAALGFAFLSAARSGVRTACGLRPNLRPIRSLGTPAAGALAPSSG